ncbi:MAG TPA: cell division protein FtsQ/DivIB [Gammaproteobacteria bacterium]|nr:cell division protein FtsQ/DivIB [Gammaproteobacteria bacterium]
MRKRNASPPASAQTSSRKGRKITLFVLFSVILVWCIAKLHNPETFPIRSVRIVDAQSFVDHPSLRETISPYLDEGMIRLKVNQLEKSLLTLPWIQSVNIQRQWPDKLIVTITEQKPGAHWDKTELLNTDGKIFAPQTIPSTLKDLPWLYGPTNNATDLWAGYQDMSSLVAPLGLKIVAVNLSPSDAWEIELNNGMPIVLGKDEVITRLKRFVEIYPKIFDNNANAVEYIDLRYNNGLAVKWKGKE